MVAFNEHGGWIPDGQPSLADARNVSPVRRPSHQKFIVGIQLPHFFFSFCLCLSGNGGERGRWGSNRSAGSSAAAAGGGGGKGGVSVGGKEIFDAGGKGGKEGERGRISEGRMGGRENKGGREGGR